MKKIILLLVLVFILSNCSGCMVSTKEKSEQTEIKDDSLFHSYKEQARKDIKQMSLEEKIGQLFLIRFDENLIEQDLQTVVPSGYVLFAKDIENETVESLSARLGNYQQRSKKGLIFAVDEEGGIVTRISRFSNFRSERFKSVRDYYLEGGIDKLVTIEEEKDLLLRSLGFNLNLAPVADVSTDPNDFMYSRTIGEDVSIVSDYIAAIVKKANDLNFAVTLKHFPGYGNNIDTHTSTSRDIRSKDTLMEESIPPFVKGIEQNVPVIMLSHNIVECYDSTMPASLSKSVHDILRSLGFTGLILTDDLDMTAVQNSLSGENEAVVAFLAGNDLIMTSYFKKDRLALLQAVEQNIISESDIDEKVEKILAFKYQYKILIEK